MFSARIGYPKTALEPLISAETVSFHYGKHHVGYANTLNSLIKGTSFEKLSLENIIEKSRGVDQKVFNNAAQLFNHDFYWECLKKSEANPSEKFINLVSRQFGNFDKFLNEYISFATALFGSGWSWLVLDSGSSSATPLPRLSFLNTSNAENPVGSQSTPVCVIDLWEHAYYIDYRNNRAEYVQKVVKNCINWGFCESRLRIAEE